MQRRIFAPEHDQFRDAVRRYIEESVVPSYDAWQRQAYVPRDEWGRRGKARNIAQLKDFIAKAESESA